MNIELTKAVNNEKHADLNIEPIILFNKEKTKLLPLPKNKIMEQYLENNKKVKVTNESLIRYKGKAFSVKPEYINCNVNVEEHKNRLYIYYKNNLIETYDLEQYDKKINYKTEHYCEALAQSFGNNVKQEEIEQKALENLKNLSMIGGIANGLQ